MLEKTLLEFEQNSSCDFSAGHGKNAWYVQKPSKDSIVHIFDCICGHSKHFTNKKIIQKYICEKCGESRFIAKEYVDKKMLPIKVGNILDFNKTDIYFTVTCYFDYPHDIDTISKKILYQKKAAYTLKVNTGNGKLTFSSNFKVAHEVQYLAYRELLNYIGKQLERKIKNFCMLDFYNQKLHIQKNIINFFLTNPFKEAEIFYMDLDYLNHMKKCKIYNLKKMLSCVLPKNSGKALTKVFYLDFISSIKQGCYSPINKKIILKIFQDQNFSRRLIEKKAYIIYGFTSLDYTSKIDIYMSLFDFFKKFYTQREIYNIILQIQNERQYWEDILLMFAQNSFAITEYFQKTRANIEDIHDAMVMHTSLSGENILFKYSEKQFKTTLVHVDDLSFKLPKNSHALKMCGLKMHNCIGSYSASIKEQRSILVIVYKNDKIKYAIELSDKKIVQMSGMANNHIPHDDEKKIMKWYKQTWLRSF